MDELFLLSGAGLRNPQIDIWFSGFADPLGSIARKWFNCMQSCGDDVRELLHDGCPVACVGNAPFGYVNVFKAHVNVGFYCGAMLADPFGLLEGNGKRMRHVKLRPGKEVNTEAMSDLIEAAYHSIRQRLSRPAESLQKAPSNMKQNKSVTKAAPAKTSLPQQIDAGLNEQNDWRSEMLARVRSLIQHADPEVVEEIKWRKPSNGMLGVPVWSHDGIICTGETYKHAIKLTFAKGASLEDPAKLFNSSLEGNTRRAIDLNQGDKLDEKAFKALICAAVALNTSGRVKTPAIRSPKKPRRD